MLSAVLAMVFFFCLGGGGGGGERIEGTAVNVSFWIGLLD